jgi:hypothetical protein
MVVRGAKRKEQNVASAASEVAPKFLDACLKDLIDNLIVPHLVEEFLRVHKPSAVDIQTQAEPRNSLSLPDSELNSTP